MKTNLLALNHYSEILNDARVRAELDRRAPSSKFSGKPLTVVSSLADQRNPLSTRLAYENCTEADWWVGQDDGIYTRQHRQAITPDEIESAAIAAGLDRDEVILLVTNLRLEMDQSKREFDDYLAKQNQEVEEIRLQKCAAYSQAADDEKREMLYAHFVQVRQLFGGRAANRRKTLRKQLAKQSPPATFDFK